MQPNLTKGQMLRKCDIMAMNRGQRIAYNKDRQYELLSYDCRSLYFIGTVEGLYNFLKEKPHV